MASTHHLVVLETAETDDLLRRMRVLAMRSGTSVYGWEPGSGLASLRESGLHVPGSKRLTDALRYVMQSMHFGIYLFSGFEGCVLPVDTLLLRRISRTSTSSERKLVFMGRRVDLAEELDGMYDRIVGTGVARPQLRLRDGRWVA